MTDKLRWDRELGAAQSKKIALYSVDALIPVAILKAQRQRGRPPSRLSNLDGRGKLGWVGLLGCLGNLFLGGYSYHEKVYVVNVNVHPGSRAGK